MNNMETSVVCDDGGKSQALAISTTSAASAVINADYALVTLTTAAFVRKGDTPTALSTGVDIYLLANRPYRINMQRGQKLAFITPTGTGTAYITPGA